ncbi:MAG: DUF4412 domain-containing protein [Candidatus Sericytochromatia bacterium]|nr:DUF4412 domain-containing protein [Candidatus Sericytochromatia bacterium]
MIKNLKKQFVIISTLLLAVATPAMSATQNIQLKTESAMNANGQKIIVNSTILYGDKKIRMENEIVGNKNIPASMGKSTMIYDSAKKVMYMMMPQNKTVVKADSETIAKLQGNGGGNVNSQLLSDPSQIQAQIKKQGGKMVGAETILGYLCDIWQMKQDIPMQGGAKESATVKIWLAHKISIPLRMLINSPTRGEIVSIRAKDIKTGVNIPASTFEIPSGYTVSDVAQLMNQIKKRVPATKK